MEVPMWVPETIYFVHAESVGLVKIGVTRGDPSLRMKALACGSPVPLGILATMIGGASAEHALHRRFAAHHSHGEWFRLAPEVVAYVEANATPWSGAWTEPDPIPHAVPEEEDIEGVALVSCPPSHYALPGPTANSREWGERTRITIRGVDRTAAEWSEVTGIGVVTIKRRLAKNPDPGLLFHALDRISDPSHKAARPRSIREVVGKSRGKFTPEEWRNFTAFLRGYRS